MYLQQLSVFIRKTSFLGLIFTTVSVLLLTGCTGPQVKSSGPLFFPPPPNEPKVQYLMSVSGSNDIVPEKISLSLFSLGGTEQEKEINIGKPFGIAIRGTNLYITDSSGKVIIVDLVQKQINYLKGDFAAGHLKKPIGLSLDKEGNLYVADSQRKEVLIYDKDGNFTRAVGSGLDMKPVDVCADDNFIYILDSVGSSIKVLDRKDGELVREIGKEGKPEERMALPISLDQDDRGFLYVTNALSGKVMQFDRDGHLINSYGQLGDGFGQFGRPRGIFTDRDKITYVVDASHQNVQMFNEKGRLLMFFGDPGSKEGSLNMPADVAVGYEGLEYFQKMADPSFVLEKIIYVTSQFGKSKITVYGFGHKK